MTISNTFSVTVQASTALATAASGLTSNATVIFDIPPFDSKNQIQQLTTNFYYDRIRREAQVMGKPASSQDGGTHKFSHFHYTEATQTWVKTWDERMDASTTSGHLWNHCFDYATGDYYFVKTTDQFIYRFNRSTWGGGAITAWEQTSVCPNSWMSTLGVSSHCGLGYHPNLFGPGDGGVIVRGIVNAIAWRKSTDTWQRIAGPYTNPSPHRNHPGGGASHWFSDTDIMVIGTGEDGGQSSGRTPLQFFNAGSGGLVNTSPGTSTTDPNVIVAGQSSTTNHAHMVVNPHNATELLLLEKVSTRRWWRSTDRGNTWSQMPGVHPFFPGEEWFSVCSIPDYGVLWAVHSGQTLGIANRSSLLWNPPS